MTFVTSLSRFEVPEEKNELGDLHLWGIDGDLQGNEGRIQGLLPFLRREGEERVLAARTVDWSLDTGMNLTTFASEGEASHFGTKLFLQKSVVISPGQLVVLVGPEFLKKLSVTEDPETAWIKEFNSAQQGFRIACLKVEEYEQLARHLSKKAKETFDREIQRLRGQKLSQQANAALWVLRNTGYAPVYDQAIRTLIAERIQQTPDLYRKSLKLAALRLKKEPEALEQDMKRHLDVLLHKTAEAKGIVFLRKFFFRPHRAALHRNKYRPVTLEASRSSKKAHRHETERSL